MFLSSLVDTRISIENNYCFVLYVILYIYCGTCKMSRHFNWEFIGKCNRKYLRKNFDERVSCIFNWKIWWESDDGRFQKSFNSGGPAKSYIAGGRNYGMVIVQIGYLFYSLSRWTNIWNGLWQMKLNFSLFAVTNMLIKMLEFTLRG